MYRPLSFVSGLAEHVLGEKLTACTPEKAASLTGYRHSNSYLGSLREKSGKGSATHPDNPTTAQTHVRGKTAGLLDLSPPYG
ncbi:hypothetical protein PC114_g7853 [Phytophthora cactorum]|nr:hypothetical protein PC114_g7853 [Phytophthora cactorum]KAG3188737.1 hypothetical protein PC128_g12087 [Phytophthora cactorum]